MNKSEIIYNYISNFDFSRNWTVEQIKQDLRIYLGEEPAVNVNYVKDVILNEVNSEAKEVKMLDTISISYSPNLDYSIETITFKINTDGRI